MWSALYRKKISRNYTSLRRSDRAREASGGGGNFGTFFDSNTVIMYSLEAKRPVGKAHIIHVFIVYVL